TVHLRVVGTVRHVRAERDPHDVMEALGAGGGRHEVEVRRESLVPVVVAGRDHEDVLGSDWRKDLDLVLNGSRRVALTPPTGRLDEPAARLHPGVYDETLEAAERAVPTHTGDRRVADDRHRAVGRPA